MTRMLCTFCPPTILGDFYRIPEKSPKSSADKMYTPCESKDRTLKKIKTLHFPDDVTLPMPHDQEQPSIRVAPALLLSRKEARALGRVLASDHAYVFLAFLPLEPSTAYLTLRTCWERRNHRRKNTLCHKQNVTGLSRDFGGDLGETFFSPRKK